MTMHADYPDGTPMAMFGSTFDEMRKQTEDGFDRFWRGQEAILKGMEAFSSSWFARRHIGAAEALRATHAVAASSSPVEAMDCWRDWLQGSFERTMEDFECARGEFARIAEHGWGDDAPAGEAKGEHKPARSKTRDHGPKA